MSDPDLDLRDLLARGFADTATAHHRKLGEALRLDLADTALAILGDDAAEQVTQEMWERVRLRELEFRNGTAHMGLADAQQVAAGFVAAARALLDGSEHYTEMTFTAKVAESPRSYVFTVRRADGLTPHELREKAEKERDEARETVGRVRHALEQIRERAADAQYAMYESAFTDAADLLEGALEGAEDA